MEIVTHKKSLFIIAGQQMSRRPKNAQQAPFTLLSVA
jgi:hypothetical protein